MAIKGKKKSRGSSPRRPAAAPRPTVGTGRRRVSFWRTRDGILILSVFVLVAIGTVFWLISNAANEREEEKLKADAVTQYTNQIGPALEGTGEAAAAMSAITAPPADDELDQLGKDAKEWVQTFQQGETLLTQVFPGPDTTPFNQLFNEALALYKNAASLAEQVATIDVEDDQVAALFTNFSTQVGLANAVFESAITAFDTYRAELGMGRSGLVAPAASGPAPSMTESPPPTPTPEATDDGSDGKKNKKKG